MSTHLEPRNHLSVLSLSERLAIASLYWDSIDAADTCVPKGGNREDMPESRAGGGVNRVERDRSCDVGVSRVRKEESRDDRGCDRT